METRKQEECYYCENVAEYNDLVGDGVDYFVTGVCKVHTTKYCEGS